MANRQVTHVRRNEEGDILALCNPGEAWSPRDKAKVIEDIKSELHTYLVELDGEPVKIVVAGRGLIGGVAEHLRTTADDETTNNLDNLPLCDAEGRPKPGGLLEA